MDKKSDTFYFPRLDLKTLCNNNLLAQHIQISEENGELAELIGIFTGATGKRKQIPDDIIERIAEEAIDVAQTACGVIFILEELHGLNVKKMQQKHLQKMKDRGYWKFE